MFSSFDTGRECERQTDRQTASTVLMTAVEWNRVEQVEWQIPFKSGKMSYVMWVD